MPTSASFILLREPPSTYADMHNLGLGAVSDGVYVAESFPVCVELCGLIRFEFGGEEHGTFHVTLRASSVSVLTDEAKTVSEDVVEALETMEMQVAPPDDDWNIPRVVFLPFRIPAWFTEESDILLWVSVADKLLVDHPVVVRLGP